MEELIVEVCSREEASAILSSPSQRANVTFVVSIGDPHDNPPAGYGRIRNKLRLLFADTTDDDGPTEEHVRDIIAAARRMSQHGGRVVIHCAAGISRSSAAAVILQSVLLGAGREEEAVARVFEQRPIARPNRKMIQLADELLELDGRLIAAVNAR